MSMSTSQHKASAAGQGPIGVAIVTVSDTRTPETDENAAYLRVQIVAAGHTVSAYRLVKDEADQVAAALDELATSPAQVIIFNGGTGISTRDRTFDVLSRKLEKTLPGFGELFRLLSYDQVGSAAMLSRATAGIYRDRIVFSTPGSPSAVRLAWEKLIVSEIQHLVWEMER